MWKSMKPNVEGILTFKTVGEAVQCFQLINEFDKLLYFLIENLFISWLFQTKKSWY